MTDIRIGSHLVGPGHPVYVIAEVGSNFDGDLGRAKALADLAKDSGADAYKIQNFSAPKIVSNAGFKQLKVAFQAKWDKPVVEVYRKAEFPREWLEQVARHCADIGIDFFSSPYDTDAVDQLEAVHVPAHKIGSGEIDNLAFLRYCAKSGKPVILACGAATIEETEAAVQAVRSTGNQNVVLLQCVTNYPSPVADANLRAMRALGDRLQVVIGYSDHTTSVAGGGDDPLGGITVPLAAVALGACMIEKHFTDDRKRPGPDHPFAMEASLFKQMVAGIRTIERAFGDGIKRVMPSEQQTVIIQRRGAYALRDLKVGDVLTQDVVELLRPATGLRPAELQRALGRKLSRDVAAGDPVTTQDLAPA